MDILLFSPTEGTRKAAYRFLTVSGGKLYDKTKKRDRERGRYPEGDVLIASPVYAGRLPEIVVGEIKKLSGRGHRAAILLTYGNRDYDDALLEAADLLKEQKYEVVAAGAFIAEHSYSTRVAARRPDGEDLKKVGAFADEVMRKVEERNPSEPEIPGNRPYKARPEPSGQRPKTTGDCINCKICVKVCPVDAIDYHHVAKISDNCINCSACVKICPVNAKYFDDGNVGKFRKMLEEKCMDRKEPEVFL